MASPTIPKVKQVKVYKEDGLWQWVAKSANYKPVDRSDHAAHFRWMAVRSAKILYPEAEIIVVVQEESVLGL